LADTIRHKYIYADCRFVIFIKNNKWWLDFYFDKERYKRTTKLSATKENLQIVKKEIVPSVVEFLTGKVQVIEEQREYALNEFADRFFSIHKKEVRLHTYKRNLQHFKNHIEPYFGDKLLTSILPIQLNEWQNKKLEKYKPLTVQKYRSILFSIFDMAVVNDLLDKNPLTKIKAPKVQNNFSNDDDISPFTQKELDIILSNSSGYLKNFIELMVSTGIRPGEIVALKWSDIDFDNRTITINKTTVSGTVGNVKTPSSIRKVDMLPQAYNSLQKQLLLTQNYYTVFINQSKEPFFSHDIIAKLFKELLTKSNIKHRPLYNLRHTFTTQMISKGIDITWVSKMLGHKDVSITLKKYTKFFHEDNNERLNKLNAISKILDS
jgi:integrase